MKTIVNKKVCKEIFVDQLEGKEIVAYKCKSIGGIKFKTKIYGKNLV